MARRDPAPYRELRDWLSQSMAEAEAILPALLDLPLPVFHLKLSVRPELRTVGMMQCLLDLAEKTLGRMRRHAFELTTIAVEIVEEVVLPPHEQEIRQRLRGQAWKTHARALRGLGRLEKAHEAISTARAAFGADPANGWFLATVDSIEARILHGLGRRKEALALAQRAVLALLSYEDAEGLLEAGLTEALIVREVDGWDAMARRWLEIAERAHELRDESLLARLDYQIGIFELRHGSSRIAWQCLRSACDEFRRLGMTAEAIAAHRAMADVAMRLQRPNDAISERYKAYGDLLRSGDLHAAAVVAAQILEVLLPLGRDHEAVSFASGLAAVFEERGLPSSALYAFHWLRWRSEAKVLSVDDAVAVRRYFEDLFLRPRAVFEPPDRERFLREIVRLDDFEAALGSLGPGAHLYVALLEQRIAATPERNPVLKNGLRILRARAYARYPALRIFYTYDDAAVYLLHVDLDDELAE
ncbi:MAG: hypothetical protein ACXW5U_07195 [Thermoanaerobaculia bacterium]